MKVGFVFASLDPQFGGGFTYDEEILLGLGEVAEQTRHTFVIFYESEQPVPQIEMLASHKIDIERIESRSASFISRVMSKLTRKPRFEDIVLRSGVEFMMGPHQRLVDRILDIPYVFVLLDLQHRVIPWFPEVSEKGLWDSREAFFSTVLRRAYAVVVGTEVGAAEVRSFYQVPEERIRVLPHPTPDFSLEDLTSVDRQGGAYRELFGQYLLYPAQFWAHKNHVNLLLGLKLVRDSLKLPLKLVLTGSNKGNLEFVKGKVRGLDLESDVHFLGFVPRDNLVALYKEALALTYISFGGPENLPPLEAFALGCPVVASDILGAREQLGDAALFVDPSDPVSIAEGIRRIYDDAELRNALVSRGRLRSRKWTRKDLIEGLMKIFDEFEAHRRCWGSVDPEYGRNSPD